MVFPPYFAAGAIFCGFAMVFAIAIPVRRVYRLEGYVTIDHLDKMAKLMLAAGIVGAGGMYGLQC